MNRTIFNKSLFANTFSRLKIPGIVFAVVCTLISLIYPINQYMTLKQTPSNQPYSYQVNIADVTPALFVFMFLGVMVLSFIAFSFLNSRKASDFYHSLSNTKVCTYTSISLAVLSWIYITIITTVLITSFTFFALGVTLNSIYPIYLIFTFLSCATLVAAACFIAVSITGTVFTNVIVTGLVLMLPRLISFVFKSAVVSIAVNSTGAELGMFFNPKYNLPFALSFSGLGLDRIGNTHQSINELLTSPGSIVYTFVLALIYLAIGCFLFHRRKSEIAEKSAPNKILQHIYRMSITLPILLIAVSLYAYFLNYRASFFTYHSSSLMFIFIISLIVYFVYELITTKKLKNLLKAIPLYFVLVVITLGLGFGANIVGNKIISITPEPNEIESISITGSQNNYSTDYLAIKTQDIKFDDDKIIKMVSTSLKDNFEQYKKSNYYGYPNRDTDYRSYTLHLKNGKSIQKGIHLTMDDVEKLNQLKSKVSEYASLLRELPSEKEISNINIRNLSQEQSMIIWNSFVEEANSLNDKDFMHLTQLNPKHYGYDIETNPEKIYSIAGINISGSIGIHNFDSYYSITSLTPKTAAIYISMVNGSSKEYIKAETGRIIDYDPKNSNEYHYTITIYSFENGEDYYNGLSFNGSSYYDQKNDKYAMSIEASKKIFEIIKNSGFQNAELGKPFVQIDIFSREKSGQFFMTMPDDDLMKIIDIYTEKMK